jgi:hypothetical protein
MPRIYIADGYPAVQNYASTFYLKDASFVRLKNIQVGYNVPKVILDKVKLQSLRVYFAGDNLLTISKFLDLTLNVLALAVTMCHILKIRYLHLV